jgi:hypothetical protein
VSKRKATEGIKKESRMSKPWYQNSFRRMLVDMHIPDWDEKFLSEYDVSKTVDLYEKARLTSVMFYCNSRHAAETGE